jgi:acyl-CoA thioester hydrolase
MNKHLTEIRVRYGETDQMGFVYYGVYATYLEVARVEMLRAAGINYRDLEFNGLLMPVTQYQIRYFKPARYDDLIQIHTSVVSMAPARIIFTYTLFVNEIKICEASTTLAFLDAQTLRPTRCPKQIAEAMSHFFNG